jgi:hypothetical protein
MASIMAEQNEERQSLKSLRQDLETFQKRMGNRRTQAMLFGMGIVFEVVSPLLIPVDPAIQAGGAALFTFVFLFVIRDYRRISQKVKELEADIARETRRRRARRKRQEEGD